MCALLERDQRLNCVIVQLTRQTLALIFLALGDGSNVAVQVLLGSLHAARHVDQFSLQLPDFSNPLHGLLISSKSPQVNLAALAS